MIPQTISTDEVISFEGSLLRQGFTFPTYRALSIEELAQVLSAWQEWNKTHCGHPRSSIVTASEGTSYCKDCEKKAQGFERLDQLKKEN